MMLACIAGTGCSSSTPFPLVQIKGKVIYEDGAPVPGGKLYFSPLAPPENGIHPKTGVADINGDGTFALTTTYKYGDGITEGKNHVFIMQAFDAQGNSLVPPLYEDPMKSPLEIDTADSPLEIKVPRP